ncbi:hypothetical protein [Pseudocolwellia agarivorans]|uniref:hypothetical protein n=1 Tax=Pseudocolwellia agarivorans TaxID=1911682 RepID=UPI003F884703
MKDRNFRFAIIAVIIFIFGAKFVMPFEDDLKQYGFIAIALIMLVFTGITYLIENVINKICIRYFGSDKSKSN